MAKCHSTIWNVDGDGTLLVLEAFLEISIIFCVIRQNTKHFRKLYGGNGDIFRFAVTYYVFV